MRILTDCPDCERTVNRTVNVRCPACKHDFLPQPDGGREIRTDGGLAPCQMCDNGLADHFPTVDGDDLELCSSCYSLFKETGRLGDCTEVPA